MWHFLEKSFQLHSGHTNSSSGKLAVFPKLQSCYFLSLSLSLFLIVSPSLVLSNPHTLTHTHTQDKSFIWNVLIKIKMMKKRIKVFPIKKIHFIDLTYIRKARLSFGQPSQSVVLNPRFSFDVFIKLWPFFS